MGGQFSRRRVEVLAPELNTNHIYTYPPSDGGHFFTTHYHLGSRKFETIDPEHFLFAEQTDINYMTAPPTAFPYRQPPKKKPIECLYSMLNMHKETVKLVRLPDDPDTYSIEFLFDAEVPCQIYVFYSLLDISSMETLHNGTTPSAITKVSQCYSYDKGLEQRFSQPSLTLNPSDWMEEKLTYDPESGQNLFPVAILLETQSSDHGYQSMLTICKLDKSIGDSYIIKVMKQKMLLDNMEYIIHEIFGLENKAVPKEEDEQDEDNNESDDSSDDDDDDLGAECVICFTDIKDTILLPCRHFCICASCAADLRYQASNCPICRSPFQALVQIQALQSIPSDEQPDDDEITNNAELYSVPGYRTLSLIQALNGYPKIKVAKNQNTAEIPMSTGDEEEEGEEEDDMNVPQDTVIPIELPLAKTGLSLEEKSDVQLTPLQDDHTPSDTISIHLPGTPTEDECLIKTNGFVKTGAITITASIESGLVTTDNQFSDNTEDFRSRKLTGSSSIESEDNSWPSSNSVSSFSSRDGLLGRHDVKVPLL